VPLGTLPLNLSVHRLFGADHHLCDAALPLYGAIPPFCPPLGPFPFVIDIAGLPPFAVAVDVSLVLPFPSSYFASFYLQIVDFVDGHVAKKQR
jgi:hypothetical protein